MQDFFNFLAAWKIWKALFHDFVWSDWFLLLACIAAIGIGVLKGFGFYWGLLIRILILIFAVELIYPPFFEWASDRLTFASPSFWEPFIFIAVAAVVIFILHKLARFQPKKKAAIHFHPVWDGVLGGFAGFFYVLLAASLLANFFLLLPNKKIAALFTRDGSRYGVIVRDFVPQLVDTSLTPVRTIVNRKVTHP